MLDRKRIDKLVSLDNNVDNGSEGECNSDNFTYPPTQHILGVLFLNLRLSQYPHMLFIFSIKTLG